MPGSSYPLDLVIQKLNKSCAADIHVELLKCAEEPSSYVLCDLFIRDWQSGSVLAAWYERSLLHYTRERDDSPSPAVSIISLYSLFSAK